MIETLFLSAIVDIGLATEGHGIQYFILAPHMMIMLVASKKQISQKQPLIMAKVCSSRSLSQLCLRVLKASYIVPGSGKLFEPNAF